MRKFYLVILMISFGILYFVWMQAPNSSDGSPVQLTQEPIHSQPVKTLSLKKTVKQEASEMQSSHDQVMQDEIREQVSGMDVVTPEKIQKMHLDLDAEEVFYQFMERLSATGADVEGISELFENMDVAAMNVDEFIQEIMEFLPFESRKIFEQMLDRGEIPAVPIKSFVEEFQKQKFQASDLSEDVVDIQRISRKPELFFDEDN